MPVVATTLGPPGSLDREPPHFAKSLSVRALAVFFYYFAALLVETGPEACLPWPEKHKNHALTNK